MGAMIALVPSCEDAKRLAVPDAEAVDDLHVTLVFLGEASNITREVDERLRALCEMVACKVGPLNLEAFATASFNPFSVEPCAVYLISGEDDLLDDVAQNIRRIAAEIHPECPPQKVFFPHLTIGYHLDVSHLRDCGPIKFDRLRYAVGERVFDFKLGDETSTEYADDGAGHPYGDIGADIGGGDMMHDFGPMIAAADPRTQAAGIALIARDTGRVLMLQRAMGDESDENAGKWELPGGRMDEGEDPYTAAQREFEEETGCKCCGDLATSWISPDGVYQGFVKVCDSEEDVNINPLDDDRYTENPDSEHGIETCAWWDPADLPEMPALREEVRSTPWHLLKIPGPINASFAYFANELDERLKALENGMVAARKGIVKKGISIAGKWNEALHPRGKDGQFIEKGGTVRGTFTREDGTLIQTKSARVLGFRTGDGADGEDPWVLAEITKPDGTKERAVTKASEIQPDGAAKARLDQAGPSGLDQPLGSIPPSKVSEIVRSDDEPVEVDSVTEALQLLSDGKKVRLQSRDEVVVLVDEMARIAQEAQERGDSAPRYNLCNVMVADSSLFCPNSQGVPRLEMPQLRGTPVPGSRADNTPRDGKGRVDLNVAFRDHLESKGIAVTDDTVPASHLKATQNELDGASVGRMAEGLQNGAVPPEPMFVSQDGYILDGHHRWAGTFINGEDNELQVKRVDMDIIDLLAEASDFTEEWGLQTKALGEVTTPTVQPNAPEPPKPEVAPRQVLSRNEVRQLDRPAVVQYINDAVRDLPLDPEERISRLDELQESTMGSSVDTEVSHDQLGEAKDQWSEERSALHEKMWDDFLAKVEAADIPRQRDALVLGGLPGAGKALAIGTLIPTPDGWTVMEHICPGDTVFDEMGKPTKVVAVSEIMYGREVYDVHFSDGSVITADAEHLWRVSTRQSRLSDAAARQRGREPHQPPKRWGTDQTSKRHFDPLLTTKEMHSSVSSPYSNDPGRSNYAVDNAGPLHLPTLNLPIDPYLLGVWLGDGHTKLPYVTVSIHDVDEMMSTLISRGHNVYLRNSVHNNCRTMGFGSRISGKPNSFTLALRSLGLIGSKHIPPMYLRASAEQRMDLVRGLMDTDGCANKNGSCEFLSINQDLVEGLRELLSSLSMKPGRLCKKNMIVNGEPYVAWRVTFIPRDKVFTLTRKNARLARLDEKRRGRRYIKSVVPAPSVPVKCLKVEAPSGMFLAGEGMIPTHNSSQLREGGAAEQFGITAWEIENDDPPEGTTHISVNPDSVKELLIRYDALPEGIDSQNLKPMEQVTYIHEESSYLAKMFLRRLGDAGYNVVLDNTMETPGGMFKRMVPLASVGYGFRAVFADITVDESLASARRRYVDAIDTPMGGRFVPSGVQRDRASPRGRLSANRDTFDELAGIDEAGNVTGKGWFREFVVVDNSGISVGQPKREVTVQGVGDGTAIMQYLEGVNAPEAAAPVAAAAVPGGMILDDQLSEDIRSGRIGPEEALQLIQNGRVYVYDYVLEDETWQGYEDRGAGGSGIQHALRLVGAQSMADDFSKAVAEARQKGLTMESLWSTPKSA